MQVDQIKVFIVSGWKRIIGKIEGMTSDQHSLSYTVSDPFILEDLHTEQGFAVIPIPGIPHKKGESIIIKSSSLVIEPFTPAEPLIQMFLKLTSNIELPSSGLILPK